MKLNSQGEGIQTECYKITEHENDFLTFNVIKDNNEIKLLMRSKIVYLFV